MNDINSHRNILIKMSCVVKKKDRVKLSMNTGANKLSGRIYTIQSVGFGVCLVNFARCMVSFLK